MLVNIQLKLPTSLELPNLSTSPACCELLNFADSRIMGMIYIYILYRMYALKTYVQNCLGQEELAFFLTNHKDKTNNACKGKSTNTNKFIKSIQSNLLNVTII